MPIAENARPSNSVGGLLAERHPVRMPAGARARTDVPSSAAVSC
jgi:hypothetical protein